MTLAWHLTSSRLCAERIMWFQRSFRSAEIRRTIRIASPGMVPEADQLAHLTPSRFPSAAHVGDPRLVRSAHNAIGCVLDCNAGERR